MTTESEKLNNVFRLTESGIKLSIGQLSIIIGEKTSLDADGVLVQVIHQLDILSKKLAKIMEIKDRIEQERILLYEFRILKMVWVQYPIKVFSAANMAGFMGVDALRNDIASDLGWFKHPLKVLSAIKVLQKICLNKNKNFFITTVSPIIRLPAMEPESK